jgi:endonuclease YncB( thermonuclease family)
MPIWLKNLLIPFSISVALTLCVYVYQLPWNVILRDPIATWPSNYSVQKDIQKLTKVQILQVYDGDTAEVLFEDGQKEKVRFLNIDTPETHHPRIGRQCYGSTASALTAKLLGKKTVYLERDIENKDKYDRLLRHIYLQNPEKPNEFLFINLYLVGEGYAHTLIIKPNITNADIFTRAQDFAKSSGKGLWSACTESDFKRKW